MKGVQQINREQRVASDYQEVSSLAAEITEYFETHPHAADSLDGIIKWWLVKRHPPNTHKSVLDALEYLCEKGVVKKVQNQSGSIIYSRANHH